MEDGYWMSEWVMAMWIGWRFFLFCNEDDDDDDNFQIKCMEQLKNFFKQKKKKIKQECQYLWCGGWWNKIFQKISVRCFIIIKKLIDWRISFNNAFFQCSSSFWMISSSSSSSSSSFDNVQPFKIINIFIVQKYWWSICCCCCWFFWCALSFCFVWFGFVVIKF